MGESIADTDDGPSTPEIPSGNPQPPFILSIVLILLFVGLIVWLYADSGAHPSRFGWALTYVAVAVVTGLIFWTYTHSSGEFNWTEMGIKLGGGAAVGAGFMVLAWALTPTPTPSPSRWVALSITNSGSVPRIIDKRPEIRHVFLVEGHCLVVLNENADYGEFAVGYYRSGDGKWVKQWVRIPRGTGPAELVTPKET